MKKILIEKAMSFEKFVYICTSLYKFINNKNSEDS